MAPTYSIDILSDGETLLTIKKIREVWSFSFRESYLSLVSSPREILDFLTGKKPIKSGDKLYFWQSYPDEMKPKPEVLSSFVIMLMKEEIELCKSDKDYFYETYCKLKN